MPKKTERRLPGYAHFGIFFLTQVALAFVFQQPASLFRGFFRILFSSSVLITDYIAVGGLGAALFNAGVIGLVSLLSLRIARAELNGAAVAGLLTICGFALFGKNLYNSLPITAGVFLHARLRKIPYRDVAVSGLFATSLGPLVSELSFGLGLSVWSGILAGCGAGIFIGLIILPLADSCFHFHQGFNLYNIGFTAGIIGMFATGILRMFDLQVEPRLLLSSGNNAALSVYLLVIFAALLLFGLHLNGWKLTGYREMLALSGRLKTDFIADCGYGITLVNIAFMGLISWAYVLLVGGDLNGATIGGIFTVMGFAAFGKHPKNTLPIYLGAFLASALNVHPVNATTSVIATLFGATLAPIAGYFGAVAGVIAGFCHVSMVMNIGYLHGGMNLYNNGFSGGFIAATLVPLFTVLHLRVKVRTPAASKLEEDKPEPYGMELPPD